MITIKDNKGKKKNFEFKVMKIESKNIRGVAQNLRLIEDEETINLEGGEEFVIVLFPVEMLKGDI